MASVGGVFDFSDADFYDSIGRITLNKPIVSMAEMTNGRGYWFVASNDGVFAFGHATFCGASNGLASSRCRPAAGTSR